MGNKAALFERTSNVEFIGLTYDDLTIRNEQISHVTIDQVDVSSRVSRNIELTTPIIASPMTTITGTEMMIAMAELGGIAAVPYSHPVEDQKRMLREVKHRLRTRINNPVSAFANQTVEETLARIEETDTKPTTLPVVNSDGIFAGLVTKRELAPNQTELGRAKQISDIMKPADEVVTAAPETTAKEAYDIMSERGISLLPLIDPNTRKVSGLYLFDNVRLAVEGSHMSLDKYGSLRTAASISTFEADALARIKEIHRYVDLVILDTSHGELIHPINTLQSVKHALKVLKEAREDLPDIDIMAGNISAGIPAIELVRRGADAIRAGQSPGSICISGQRLGGGAPQATAVYDVAKAVAETGEDVVVCADGGIRDSGDVTKALSLGAGVVMVGGLVAATDEAAGKRVRDEQGRDCKEYMGMGSSEEQLASIAARQRYGIGSPKKRIYVEGVAKKIPLKGPVADIIEDTMTGVAIQMSASGFKDIPDIQEGVSYIRRTPSAIAAAGAS